MQIIKVTLSQMKQCRAFYSVNKYAADALNTVPEMINDQLE